MDWAKLDTSLVVDTILAMSAELLTETPPPRSAVPAAFHGSEVSLPESVATSLAPFAQVGVQHADDGVGIEIQHARNLIDHAGAGGQAGGGAR